MSSAKQQQKYERWWKGQRLRRAGSDGQFRKCVDVEFVGPPSGMTGIVVLAFDDGSSETVGPHAERGMIPQKYLIEVAQDDAMEGDET